MSDFRKLHESGCFVLPNPWDPGSAFFLYKLGFKALATTSAGFAFSQALSDSAVPRELMLAHVAQLVAATPLPVNADFQNGYADEPERVAENVALCVRTGAAGLSIEDSNPAGGLYDRALAIERIAAARRAAGDAVLTARCEAYLVGAPDPERTVLDRLPAFAAAGADCLYAPGVRDLKVIAAIVKAVAPKPVNVLAWAGVTVAKLEALGVRRISVGGALARAAWAGFARSAREIASSGKFDSFTGAMPFDELEALFRAGS